MPFLDFCRKVASDEPLIVQDAPYDELLLPQSLKVLVDIMKPKMDRLDRLSLGFIECYFDDMDEVVNTLEQKCCGEIPDKFIVALADKLYGYRPLDNDEQAIIKVLATYFMLQY